MFAPSHCHIGKLSLRRRAPSMCMMIQVAAWSHFRCFLFFPVAAAASFRKMGMSRAKPLHIFAPCGDFQGENFWIAKYSTHMDWCFNVFCSLLRFLGHSAPIAHPGLRRWRMGWSVAMSPSVPWLGILFSIQPGMMIIGDPH